MPSPTQQRIASPVDEDPIAALEMLEPESEALDAAPDQSADHVEPDTPTWKKLTAVGAWLMAVFFLYALIGNLRQEPTPLPATGGFTTAAAPSVETPVDSLGMRFEEVRQLWNSLDRPPSIAQPLRRFPETGQLDSFFHLFDTSAVFAGAIDSDDDYIVAFMVRSNLEDPSVGNMYLHLCHMIHPFSPQCIDNYFEIGLDGRTLAEYGEGDRDVSWTYQGNEWRLTIADDLQTIRVQAPGFD